MSDGTKADDIALALEEAIVSGEIPPGSTLRQEHLSEQFEVSRTPVREALRGSPRSGSSRSSRIAVFASGCSRDEIREAFMVRAELESLATEIATPKMTDDDLAELERAERRFSRATGALVEMSHEGRQDLEVARDWLHLNHSFHDVIYRAADVPLIERMAKAARRTFLVKPVWATGADLDELYQERPPAPRDPQRDRRTEPGGASRSRASTCCRPDACSRRSRQGVHAVARRLRRPLTRQCDLREPAGLVGIEAARACQAQAKSCPGTIEQQRREERRSRSRTREHVLRMGIDAAALPLATIVAPASRARSTASTTDGSVGSSEAMAQTGKSESSAATGPCARSVAVSGSAAMRHVSRSFNAISRAVANSAPRPTTNIRPAYANGLATLPMRASSERLNAGIVSAIVQPVDELPDPVRQRARRGDRARRSGSSRSSSLLRRSWPARARGLRRLRAQAPMRGRS